MLIGKGKNKRVAEHIQNIKCPSCNESGSLLMEGYQEFLILGLPVFPISKTVQVTCSACKKYFPPSSITNEMYRGVQYIKSKTKPTVWMYLLPILTVVLVFFGWRSSVRKVSENISKIEKVKTGDIYTVETGDLYYNKMEVLFVKDDAVIFHESGQSSAKLKEMQYMDSFYGDTVAYSKKDLLKLNSDHKIEEIERH